MVPWGKLKRKRSSLQIGRNRMDEFYAARDAHMTPLIVDDVYTVALDAMADVVE